MLRLFFISLFSIFVFTACFSNTSSSAEDLDNIVDNGVVDQKTDLDNETHDFDFSDENLFDKDETTDIDVVDFDNVDNKLDVVDEDNAVDVCKDVLCSNHGKCIVENSLPKCDCDSGYEAKNLECIKTNPGVAKILFDAAHGVTSGNADWRIDESSPKPTPSNPTSEKSWNGGISRWAFELYKTKNYDIYNTTSSTQISYGTSSSLDLKNFDIFVSCEPNKPYNASEKAALMNFIKNGGHFILITDHKISDRDHDGWDSPRVANDFFTNNSVENNPFGITVPHDSEGYGTNVTGKYKNMNSKSSVINGPFGVVKQINFHNGSEFIVDKTKGGTILAWSSFSESDSKAISVIVPYKKGWFAILGDSSPVDDGTGNSHDKLYDGWDEADDGAFLMNLTDFMRTH